MNLNFGDDWVKADLENDTILILRTIETALPNDLSWAYPYMETDFIYEMEEGKPLQG